MKSYHGLPGWALGVVFSAMFLSSAPAEDKIKDGLELKLDSPVAVRELCGVSEPHGLVFIQPTIEPQNPLALIPGVKAYDVKTGKMTSLSEFSKGIPEKDAMRIWHIKVSPCGNYVLCKKSDEEFYTLDLKDRSAVKTTFTGGDEVEVYGWCGTKWYCAPMNKKLMQSPAIEMRDTKGKKLDFPKIHGFPLVANPDGSRMAIFAFQEDLAQPVGIEKAMSGKNFYLASLDGKGNVVKKKTVAKTNPRQKPEVFTLTSFDSTGRYRVRLKVEENALEKNRKAMTQAGVDLKDLKADVPVELMDTKTGKGDSIKVVPPISKLFALDGSRVLVMQYVKMPLKFKPVVYNIDGTSKPVTKDDIGHRKYVFTPASATLYYIKDKTNTLKKVSLKPKAETEKRKD